MRIRSRAFMIFDALLALSVLGLLMAIMAVGLASHRRAAARLAGRRDACNAAESAMTDLQQGRPPAPATHGDRIRIDRLTGGTDVPGFTWVRVTAVVDGTTESLSGLVRTDSLKGR
jgi:hypothetical protein